MGQDKPLMCLKGSKGSTPGSLGMFAVVCPFGFAFVCILSWIDSRLEMVVASFRIGCNDIAIIAVCENFLSRAAS